MVNRIVLQRGNESAQQDNKKPKDVGTCRFFPPVILLQEKQIMEKGPTCVNLEELSYQYDSCGLWRQMKMCPKYYLVLNRHQVAGPQYMQFHQKVEKEVSHEIQSRHQVSSHKFAHIRRFIVSVCEKLLTLLADQIECIKNTK